MIKVAKRFNSQTCAVWVLRVNRRQAFCLKPAVGVTSHLLNGPAVRDRPAMSRRVRLGGVAVHGWDRLSPIRHIPGCGHLCPIFNGKACPPSRRDLSGGRDGGLESRQDRSDPLAQIAWQIVRVGPRCCCPAIVKQRIGIRFLRSRRSVWRTVSWETP